MPDELTLRDVLQQMGARLGRVEEDVRALRAEMNERLEQMRAEMNERLEQMRGEMRELRGDMDRRFGRMMGLQVTVLLALVVGIGGLWLK